MNIKEIYESFKAEWLGKKVDFDHVYNFQCVDLIRQFLYEKFNLNAGVYGNAIDYWTKPTAAVLTRFHKVASADPQASDIVILNGNPGNPYGHIGIASGNNTATTVEILEQNGSTGNGLGLGGDAIRTRAIPKNRIAGLLRANGADAPAPAPAPAPAVQNTGRVLNLPGSVSSWRVYKPGGPWTVNYAIAKLNPAQYGGLSYDIVGSPASNIYLINTQMFGQVAIYAGPDTPATFSDKPAPGLAPTPAPEPPKPANTVYTKFDKPLELITKRQPTHLWDLGFADDAHATSLEDLPKDTGFIAFGQAQRTDKDKPCYYMTEADFGSADTTGRPNRNAGVNTLDLGPKPQPQPVTIASSVPSSTLDKGTITITPAQTPAVVTSTTTLGTGLADFRDSYKEAKATFKAVKDITVKDLYAKAPDQKLGHDQLVHAAGEFVKDNKTYIRTEKSESTGIWYGIPKEDLVPVANPDNYVGKLMDVKPPVPKEFQEIEAIASEITSDPTYKEFHKQFDRHERIASSIGKTEDKLSGFFGKLKIKRSK